MVLVWPLLLPFVIAVIAAIDGVAVEVHHVAVPVDDYAATDNDICTAGSVVVALSCL